jgi:hypothetical protein
MGSPPRNTQNFNSSSKNFYDTITVGRRHCFFLRFGLALSSIAHSRFPRCWSDPRSLIRFHTVIAFILLAGILLAGSICAQTVIGGPLAAQRLTSKKRPATPGHTRRTKRPLRRKHSTHRKTTGNSSTGASQTPSVVEGKKAGDWSGDVRKLPATPPKRRERPKLPEPRVIRKVSKKPPM